MDCYIRLSNILKFPFQSAHKFYIKENVTYYHSFCSGLFVRPLEHKFYHFLNADIPNIFSSSAMNKIWFGLVLNILLGAPITPSNTGIRWTVSWFPHFRPDKFPGLFQYLFFHFPVSFSVYYLMNLINAKIYLTNTSSKKSEKNKNINLLKFDHFFQYFG